VLPHIDHYHHGSYYVDSGYYYYQPQTFVTDPTQYVVSKPVAVKFGSFSHIDDLSSRLERLANELCLDMYYNYSHNPAFAETYREAYQILQTAKYVHVKEHQDDRAEVARRLSELDPLFHHVQGEVGGWSRHHHRQIAQGSATAKIAVMEAILHHLMNDVGVKPQSMRSMETSSNPASVEAAPPPPPHLNLPQPPGGA
jgi:hypothetical protein